MNKSFEETCLEVARLLANNPVLIEKFVEKASHNALVVSSQLEALKKMHKEWHEEDNRHAAAHEILTTVKSATENPDSEEKERESDKTHSMIKESPSEEKERDSDNTHSMIKEALSEDEKLSIFKKPANNRTKKVRTLIPVNPADYPLVEGVKNNAIPAFLIPTTEEIVGPASKKFISTFTLPEKSPVERLVMAGNPNKRTTLPYTVYHPIPKQNRMKKRTKKILLRNKMTHFGHLTRMTRKQLSLVDGITEEDIVSIENFLHQTKINLSLRRATFWEQLEYVFNIVRPHIDVFDYVVKEVFEKGQKFHEIENTDYFKNNPFNIRDLGLSKITLRIIALMGNIDSRVCRFINKEPYAYTTQYRPIMPVVAQAYRRCTGWLELYPDLVETIEAEAVIAK